ncbi:hypothetical protein KIN20_022961 [Parelaphostrongylus tenuis]|uniref:Mos1 transposase HTH domain-containing protein n=1 Tax=Parelaphostrongylus tenuis TaxID=148309 RepID=A0AAD5MQX1_PARTN|nr:hypothetical protein KIN20_022961 [Parelaphostrongylus tenuis]
MLIYEAKCFSPKKAAVEANVDTSNTYRGHNKVAENGIVQRSKTFVTLYEYKFGSNAVRRFNKAWGDRTVGESTVRERFREFKAGNEELTDRPRSGRPI